ncbi:MAG TPA: ATP-binding protein [Blastocatellia bacterium]|nr:ATP-binding protein [Blastocatellia bacterium]
MGKEPFADAIKAARRRVERYQQRASAEFSQPETSEAVFEEINASLEELRVAEEELRQQNEELEAARNELENERRRYRDLFEFAPDAYLVTSKEGKITEANRAAAQLLGVEQRFLDGKTLPNFIAEDDRKNFRFLLNELKRPGADAARYYELVVTPRHREPFEAGLTFTPVHNRNGEFVAIRWLLRDLSEQKRIEERLREWNAELERRVRERTAELEEANRAQQELIACEQALRAEAEAANRSKDEFLAIISHELRTPLNAIIGWSHVLKMQPPDAARDAHAIDVIERSAWAQAQIIEDLLEVSRIVRGDLRLELRPVALPVIIESAIESVRHLVEEKGQELSLDVDRSVGLVRGDSYRLQQVVSNLLTNAIKFTPKRGAITVRLDRAGDDARITVSDTGKGISREFLPHLFERFRQADSGSTRGHGGLGLGLAIVRHLVEMHGGTVAAESEGEGHGATFTVRLPLMHPGERAAVNSSEAGEAGPDTADVPQPDLHGKRVLVVDDEADAREMLRVIFEQWGAGVTTAATVREALAAFNAQAGERPDLLIADIAMPDEDGFDLIRRVRELGPGQGGDIPAIAVTAYAGSEDRERTLNAGYQLHVPKPIKVVDLEAALSSLAQNNYQG